MTLTVTVQVPLPLVPAVLPGDFPLAVELEGVSRSAGVGVRAVSLRDDEGSILPLIAGFGAVCLALVLIVTAATSLYLERKRLFTVADCGSPRRCRSRSMPRTRPRGPALTSDQVEACRGRVPRRRRRCPASSRSGSSMRRAIDATSATVTLSAIWHPPVVSAFVPDGMRIQVTTTGRTVFF